MYRKKEISVKVNIGNKGELKVGEMEEKIIEMKGQRQRIVYYKMKVDDKRKRRKEIKVEKREIGWEKKVEMEKGMEKNIEYLENKLRKKKGKMVEEE